MEASRPLRLLDPNGEVGDHEPASYAEALVELHNARAKAERLEVENEHLTTALKNEVIERRKLKGQLHKNLRLHKDYAAAERLWGKYRIFHRRSPEEIPEDYLKMAISLLKSFDEAVLSRALDGAKDNAPVDQKTGTRYDLWANIFRNAGNMENYVKRADQAAGRHERERDPGVGRVLRELHVASLEDLAARCECGHLVVVHTHEPDGEGRHPCSSCGCEDADDLDWRAEQWVARQERRS